MSESTADIVTQLREHEDPRQYEEAAGLMLDAALCITKWESRYAALTKKCQALHRELHLAKIRALLPTGEPIQEGKE